MFTVDAIECYECSSESENYCGTFHFNENEKPVKSCANDGKSCFTEIQGQYRIGHIENFFKSQIIKYSLLGGNLTRGCVSSDQPNDLPENVWTKRVATSLYKTCSTPICNNDEIKTEFCISCDNHDSNCKSNVTNELRKKCISTPELMGCYHFEENDQIKRGCISDIQDEQFQKSCESNSDNCKRCFGNDCNSRENGFQKCLISKSSDFQNTDASTLDSKMCRNYIDQCFTLITNNTIRRGCLNDESSIHSICNDRDICEICSESNCNNRQIQNELCVICDSKLDPKCKREPHDSMWDQCPFETIRPLGCFMYEKERHVQRGCMSAQNMNFRDLCLTEGDTCKYCFGDFCNKKPYFTRCRICNSDENGEDCVRWPWKTERKTCKHYLDECFTHISENGIVTRGCFDEFESNEINCEIDSDTCVRCSDDEDGCNDKAIKLEQCITCDSKTDELHQPTKYNQRNIFEF